MSWLLAPPGWSEQSSRAIPQFPGDTLSPKARVVVVHDPEATDRFQPKEDRVREMVHRAVTNLTGLCHASSAWRSLVSTQDVVGIKVFSAPGRTSGTRPAVVAAVVQGLLDAGVRQLVIWDRHEADLRRAGYMELAERFGIQAVGSAELGYDERAFYDTPLLGLLVWGDREFGRQEDGVGRKSFVSKLVAKRITRLINVTPLLNHNSAGVCGNLYSLAMGSVDNTLRFETDVRRLATAVPEIYALPALGDRVVLNIVDALVCQYQGEQRSLLHYSTVLNEVRCSKDPVALDVLSLQELEKQRQMANMSPLSTNYWEIYHNAALLELGSADSAKIQVERVQ